MPALRCIEKSGYPSEAVALSVMRRLNELLEANRLRGWTGGPIKDVYECRCGSWHVSTMSREQQIDVELAQVRAPRASRHVRPLKAQVRIGGRPGCRIIIMAAGLLDEMRAFCQGWA